MDTVTACYRLDKEYDREGWAMMFVTVSVGKFLERRQEKGA